jgi:hypothetical protein
MKVTYIFNRPEHKRWLFGPTHIFDSKIVPERQLLKLTVYDKADTAGNIGPVCRSTIIDTNNRDWFVTASNWQADAKAYYNVTYKD